MSLSDSVAFLRKKAFFPPAKHTKFEEWLLGMGSKFKRLGVWTT